MIPILDINCKAGTMETLLIFKNALSIITILAPIILIVMSMVDIIGITSSNDPSSKKVFKKIAPKFIAMGIILLLPTIINIIMDIAQGIKLTENNCWNEATRENVNQKKEEEANALSLQEKKRMDELRERAQKELEEAKKAKLKIAEKEHHGTNDNPNSIPSGPPITGTYDIKDKDDLVGIMYTTWFDAILNTTTPSLIKNANNSLTGQYQYWGEPQLGFYKSSDTSVIKTHMTQLSNAGIDFIIIDNTNVQDCLKRGDWGTYVTTPMTALLNTMASMRENGQQTPYVVNWVDTGNSLSWENWDSVNKIYDEFYTKEKYKDLWVYWDGKPFIMTTSNPPSSSKKPITIRSMWGLIRNDYNTAEYSYLEWDNSRYGIHNGTVEQVGVSVAMQANHMSNTGSARGRNGGKTFYNQWKTAFNKRPKIVTITWWNEWAAIRQPGGIYTDNYSQEYSRDIEPMKGGHGDTYYQWMKKYITAYKSNQSCPTNLVK